MKLFSILLLLIFSYRTKAQAVFADPSFGQVFITAEDNTILNVPPAIPRETTYLLKLPIYNLNTGNAIPSGATKIKIGLGSKMMLDPAFNLFTTNTSAYFSWTAESSGGQIQLTGNQVAPLPQNYSDTGIFLVKGFILGGSTITTNFLVTNHNSAPFTLSDENGANNVSSLAYFIVESVPVTFTGLQVKEDNCAVAVNFSVENEYNLRKYIIEYSVNGINFFPAGELLPHGNGHYYFRFNMPQGVTGGIIYIRVKSEDIDGRLQYTEIKPLRDLCKGLSATTLYPNPVSGNRNLVTISKNAGVFTGNHTITLFDYTGRKINSSRMQLVSTMAFEYQLPHTLAAGNYTLRLETGIAGEEPVTLKFQKMQ